MPKKMQAGLLRVLQEKLVRPVGGSKEQAVDVRLIAATNRDLAAMVEEKTFREDLFYRLHVVEVRLPPLRERLDDIPVLIDHFLKIFAARFHRDKKTVTREASRKLSGYAWPGNVRQLENVLLNAWVLSERPELHPDDFDLPEGGRRASHVAPADTGRAPASTRAAPASAGRAAPSVRGQARARDGSQARARVQPRPKVQPRGADRAARLPRVRARRKRAHRERASDLQLEPGEGGHDAGPSAPHLLPRLREYGIQ